MTFRYVKGALGKALDSLPYDTIDPVKDLYHFLGKDGLLLPDHLRPVICMAERLFYGSFNLPKLLREIETAVLETDAAATSSDIKGKEELMKVMKLLLNARSQVLGAMSHSFASADFTECTESADYTGNIISDKVQEVATKMQ